MNNIHLSVFNHFQEPTPKSFWSFKSLNYLMTNIFTGGIVDSIDALMNLSHIKHLKLKQLDLLQQATNLTQTCGTLEARLSNLLTDFKTLDSATTWKKNGFKSDLNDLDRDQAKLFGKSIKAKVRDDFAFVDVIYDIIICVGHQIANVLTIGLYGAYQHCALNNRIAKLKAENKHIKDKVQDWQDSKSKIFRAQIDLLQHPSTQQAAAKPSTVDPKDQARLDKQIKDLKQEINKLKTQQKEAENAYKALKTTHAALKTQHADELKQQAAQFNKGYSNTWYSANVQKLQKEFDKDKEELKTKYKDRLKQQKTQLNQLQAKCDKLAGGGGQGGNSEDFQGLIDALSVENEDLQKELTKARDEKEIHLRDKNAKATELLQVRTQLLNTNQRLTNLQANATTLQTNVTALQADVQRLKPAEEYLSFKDGIGLVEPKYKIEKPNGNSELAKIKGAVGVADGASEAKWSDYAKRYNGLKTAPEVFKAGFRYALETLYGMAQEQDAKIKLNKSQATDMSLAAQVIYRFVALDFIKGGQPVGECNSYEEHVLQLNNEKVRMRTSMPEKVLECETVNGVRILSTVVHFQDRDDFTPVEKKLAAAGVPHGIDPLGAVASWYKLTDVEQGHLFNLVMEPAIEDNHPDLQAAIIYIQNASPDRAKLICNLRDLINEMGVALAEKYSTLATSEWQATEGVDTDGDPIYKYLDTMDWELQPFNKVKKQPAVAQTQASKPVVNWNLNEAALKVNQDNLGNPIFLNLIVEAKKRYQAYFGNIQTEFHENVYSADFKTDRVGKHHISKQYHISHELIGMQGCLFSNLLATLMVDSSQLTTDNILYLKKSMAAYLDQLKQAHIEVEKIKKLQQFNLPLPTHYANNYVQLQESVKLYEKFKTAIHSDHTYTTGDGRQQPVKKHPMSIELYQKWLRGETGAPTIQNSYLTPTQIDIVAHMLGIRIALFSIPNQSPTGKTLGEVGSYAGEVDAYGKLMPVNANVNEGQNDVSVNYFGPNTKETILMVSKNNYTYFGLFPKLKTRYNLRSLGLEEDLIIQLTQLNDYWVGRKQQFNDSNAWDD